MNKKIFSMLVVAMFIFSIVPLAFAENGDGPRTGPDKGDVKSMREHRIANNLTPMPIKADFKERPVPVLISEKVADAFKKREVAREHMLEAEQRFLEATKRYEAAKDRYAAAKDKFTAAIESGDEEGAKEHAKAFLTHAADMVIKSLEKVKEKAQGSDDLTEEEVAEIVADIDAKIAEIEAAKAAVEAAETKEEIKAAGAVIVDAWKRSKQKLKEHANKVVEGKVGEIISRSTALEAKLERVLANMAARNITVDDLDEKLDEFSEKLTEARALFEEGKNSTDADEAKDKVKDAHESLKDAHEIVMDLVKDIKEEGGDLDDDDSDEEEEEESDENDSDEEDDSDEDDSDDENDSEDESDNDSGDNETDENSDNDSDDNSDDENDSDDSDDNSDDENDSDDSDDQDDSDEDDEDDNDGDNETDDDSNDNQTTVNTNATV